MKTEKASQPAESLPADDSAEPNTFHGERAGRSSLRFFGPGFLVAAAFIGPGTVNTAVRAGGEYGFHLLWTVLFAGVATVIFQEMAARLGLVTRKGLAESIQDFFPQPIVRKVCLWVIFAAIIFGNTAYQAGNLTGAARGLGHFVPAFPLQLWLLVSAGLAFYLVWSGSLKTIKLVLSGMVLIMSLTFLVTAIASRPSFPDLLSGCFSFDIPLENLGIMFAIIGTTVVPYNLFLHSSIVAEQNGKLPLVVTEEVEDSREPDPTPAQAEPDGGAPEWQQAIDGVRLDTWVAVFVGALVTASIVVTAAGADAVSLEEAGERFSELLGSFGSGLFFLGLFAAGLTSAITAPLAAGYVHAGLFGYETRANSRQVRKVAAMVLLIGYVVAALFGSSPDQVIFLAQVANALVLPLIAVFLLLVMNSRKVLGPYRNNWRQNLFGGLVVAFVVALALYKLGSELGVIGR
ncbi:MAG: Nramp family divalent metal transporter [Planctomycetota bacterium]|nr:Nramp family divalent metal transporter [Planctomycetota bacterium]